MQRLFWSTFWSCERIGFGHTVRTLPRPTKAVLREYSSALKNSRRVKQSTYKTGNDEERSSATLRLDGAINHHEVPFENLKPNLHEPPKVQPVVRWYNQLTPWSKQRRLSDPENPDADDETGVVKDLKLEIDRLDEELRQMKEGLDDKTLFEPILKELSPEDQQWVKNDIKSRELQQAQRAEALKNHLPKLEIKWVLPPEQRAYLRSLNNNVKVSLLRFGDYTMRRRLWQSYARCKAFLPPFSHLIPHETWMALYRAQALAAEQDDAHWATHSIILLDDMRAAGKQLGPAQIMLLIEALRFEGRYEEGIAEWENLRKLVEKDDRAFAECELVGVRLFTSQGNLGKAEQIAEKYMEGGDSSESRILIPIIDTWIQRRDEIGMRHAWALYLTLRMRLGSDITMDDYDSICLSFLYGGRTDLALAVFKDLMLTGQDTGQDSVDIYQRSISSIEKMRDAATTASNVNRIFLTAMAVLPGKFHNKFFYAKWMKKLIGMDQADLAAAVVELMYERGISPDAKHLNGIVGAWLRTSSDDRKSKAEHMAWAMINRRLTFVKERRRNLAQDLPATSAEIDVKDRVSTVPAHLGRHVPAATIETFSMLLQYYTRRSRYDDVRFVQEALVAGEMSPNSYWLNHLLYMDLRSGRHDVLWKRYIQCFNDVVQPDLETFACLWECQQSHLSDLGIGKHKRCIFPSPRILMKDMITWLQTRNEQGHRNAEENFTRELYERIIRCMMENQDLAGTIVALHVLKDKFGCYPGREITKSVVKQVALLSLGQSSSRGSARARYMKKAQRRAPESLAEDILKLVQAERVERLVAAGYDDFEQLNDNIRRQERLFVLAEYLRTVMRKTIGGDIDVAVAEAASEMGIKDIDMDDHLSS